MRVSHASQWKNPIHGSYYSQNEPISPKILTYQISPKNQILSFPLLGTILVEAKEENEVETFMQFS